MQSPSSSLSTWDPSLELLEESDWVVLTPLIFVCPRGWEIYVDL